MDLLFYKSNSSAPYVSQVECTPTMPPRGQFVAVSSAYCALGIDSVSFKDSGLYQCQVVSNQTSVLYQIKLQVYGGSIQTVNI